MVKQTFFSQHQINNRSPNLQVEQILTWLQQEIAHLGFKGLTYVFRNGPMWFDKPYGNLTEFGMQSWFPRKSYSRAEKYLELWLSAGGQDPVSRVCSTTMLPVWWSFELEQLSGRHQPSPYQQASFDGAEFDSAPFDEKDLEVFSVNYRETGIRTGVAIPLRGVNGRYGHIAFLTENSLHDIIHKRTDIEPKLMYLGYLFYTELLDFLDPQEQQLPRLSPRERECLSLIGNGHTLDETANALEIARTTVRYHVDNSKIKLGVETRSQAIAKAASLNLLDIRH